MIHRINLENYGPFRKAKLRLGRLTVLVGPNASGKTTALSALSNPVHRQFSRLWMKQSSQPLTLGFVVGDQKAVYLPEVGFYFQNDELNFFDTSYHAPNLHGFEPPPPELPQTLHIDFDVKRLREPSYIDSPQPRITIEGYGLPTALAQLKLSDDQTYANILQQTRSIVPTFEGLRFERAAVEHKGNGEIFGDQLVYDMKNAKGLSPDQVSDGTVLTLGLLTAINTLSE